MNDENDKPKDSDWGMTMPHMRYEEENASDGFSDDFAPKKKLPPNRSAEDEWGATTPNFNLRNNDSPAARFDDFDRTEPNINIPKDVWEDETPPSNSLPADEWGMSAPNINLQSENKPENNPDEWEVGATNFNPPPPQNNWSMPAPIFRVSEGENIEDIKKTAAFKLSDLQGFDTESKTFKSSGKSSPSFDKTAPGFNFEANPPPPLPNSIGVAPVISAAPPPVVQSVEADKLPKAGKTSKTPLILGGILAMLLLVGVFAAGTYFLLLNKTPLTTSKVEPAESVQTAETGDTNAPSAPLIAAPTMDETSNLPKQLDFKGAMVLIAAGEFTMGSDRDADEAKPAHKVVLPAYYIDKTEVTNAEYKAFCDATGKSYPTNPHIEKDYFAARPNAPVVGVSFADAKAYADWAGKRLPTEEEWEKAASWDEAAQSKREFPWGNNFQKSNVAFQTAKIADVGKYSGGASPSGALDMAGNVLEWVDAYFQPYPNGASSNPEFGETNRVVRGGHFASKSSDSLKTTKRIYIPPTVASGEDGETLVAAIIGFRCAVSANNPQITALLQSEGK